jgi:type IV secretory pathway TrbL component
VNKMTFYEQVGIVIPGSVFMVGLLLYFPTLNALVVKDGVTLGQFGIFLLLSYAAGHFIAALGNVLESALWRPFGGMPSDWVTRQPSSLLSPQQIAALETKVTSRLNANIGKLSGMDRKVWWPISRQVYADVGKNGKVERIDTFNGNYGLNRGLSAACVALAIVAAPQAQWYVVIGFLGLAIVFAYRAYRFGVHYARELYLQFLVL